MAREVCIGGIGESCDEPVWGPLLRLVGPLADWFMYMYEIHLANGQKLVAYKHSGTRAYLHLDEQSRAYGYSDRGEGPTYLRVSTPAALASVFSGWAELATGPTGNELALGLALLQVALERATEEE